VLREDIFRHVDFCNSEKPDYDALLDIVVQSLIKHSEVNGSVKLVKMV